MNAGPSANPAPQRITGCGKENDARCLPCVVQQGSATVGKSCIATSSAGACRMRIYHCHRCLCVDPRNLTWRCIRASMGAGAMSGSPLSVTDFDLPRCREFHRECANSIKAPSLRVGQSPKRFKARNVGASLSTVHRDKHRSSTSALAGLHLSIRNLGPF